MKASLLKPYSIGIAAQNKAIGDWMLEVTPIEDTPLINGEITSEQQDETVNSEDQNGNAYQVNLKKAASVPAKWLPLGNGNRKTPPDVRRGAEVILWQFGDSPDLFWMTLKDDMALRKLETVVYAFSATKDESAKQTADNSYILEISSHRKLIHLHTSKANGEPFAYDIQINAGEGFIKFQDDAGNWIILDSSEKQIAMKNVDGTYLNIDKKNMTINVPETFTLIAKNVIERVGQKIDTEAENVVEKITETIDVKAKNTVEKITQTISSQSKNTISRVEQSIVTQASNISTSASAGLQQNAAAVIIQGGATVSVASPSTTIV